MGSVLCTFNTLVLEPDYSRIIIIKAIVLYYLAHFSMFLIPSVNNDLPRKHESTQGLENSYQIQVEVVPNKLHPE